MTILVGPTKYSNKPTLVKFGYYYPEKEEAADARIAITLVSTTGEAMLVATVNLEIAPEPNHVFIKNYSENEGVEEALEKAGVIEQFGEGRYARSGYVLVRHYKLTEKALKELAEQNPEKPQ